ncbi:hypothetical protein [Streptomyces althioticus]|uniref:hypothetical protein n=1 Tax=Streptomyces althioticus TaxID=83380 RepID=UPI00340B7BD4
MNFDPMEALRKSIEEMSLGDLRESILVEMKTKPVLTPETAEFLLQTYTDKLAELYW